MSDPVIVIGGGPAGLLTAKHIRSRSVVLLSLSRRPGWPPHCTGLVSPATARLIGVAEAVGESYDCIVFHGSSWGEVCRVCGRGFVVRVRRPLLEEILSDEVEGLGHKVLWGVRVEGFKTVSDGVVVFGDGLRFRGWRAVVAAGAGWAPRGCWKAAALEVRVRVERRLEDNTIHTFHLLPGTGGGYGWLVPVNGGRDVLVGIASLNPRAVGGAFERLVSIIERSYGLAAMLSRRSGLLVMGPPSETPWLVEGRVAVVGDAACMSKPFTGGGLYAIARLAPVVARLVEGNGSALEWGYVVRELTRQYVFTRVYRWLTSVSPYLARLALRAVCNAGPDYDAHSSGVARLLLPGVGV